ncbi:hypothetical protein [Mesorhizobium sp. NFR06]|uniref:hypothetical protein n=1 Tax=Mesorhizobium sp. NFR06 TaxID=1566290 RepID=UPI001FCECC4C|nr:hypothetical protein [Mesorhizobium sp. NFR06]
MSNKYPFIEDTLGKKLEAGTGISVYCSTCKRDCKDAMEPIVDGMLDAGWTRGEVITLRRLIAADNMTQKENAKVEADLAIARRCCALARTCSPYAVHLLRPCDGTSDDEILGRCLVGMTQQFNIKVVAESIKPTANCVRSKKTFHACNLRRPTNH